MSEWKRGISKGGKYPKKAFSGILKAWYPSENNNGTKLLQLDFENDIQVGIYGIGKAKITEDGVEVAGSLAQFQDSLEALGIEPLWGVDIDEILGFMTQPDLTGCKLWMEPIEDQVVGDDTQTKKSLFWGTVKKYEKVDAPPKRPGKLPAAPVIKEPDQTKEQQPQQPTATATANKKLQDRLLDELYGDPLTVSDLFAIVGKEGYKPSEIRNALDTMKEQKKVLQVDTNKWKAI